MNCSTCLNPINKGEGYYLIGGAAYCTSCYQQTKAGGEAIPPPTHLPAAQREPEDLLEAFRTYQERDREPACRRN